MWMVLFTGLLQMGCTTSRWVDPEVCKRHGIGEEEQSAEPIAETAEDESKAIKKKRSQHPVSPDSPADV